MEPAKVYKFHLQWPPKTHYIEVWEITTPNSVCVVVYR